MTDYAPFDGRRRREPSAPVLVERLWRVRSASGKILSCALHLHKHGIEARCGYREEVDLLIFRTSSVLAAALLSQVEGTPEAAKARADEWLAAAISRGFEIIDR